jgi:cytochrome c-type biogenesis protein CcmH
MRMASILALAGTLLLGGSNLAWAVQPDEMLKDPSLEARARALSQELRCMVCQNQSIDDSDAPLAKDLRVLVRERLSAGDSDASVKEFLVSRYGDFILLRPPVEWRTLLLWAAPALVLLGGLLLAARSLMLFGGAVRPEPVPLSDSERHDLEALLDAKDPPA